MTNIEEIFLSYLGSKERLVWYLENNVNLIEYLKQMNSVHLIIANVVIGLIPKKRRIELAEEFNSKKIIELLKLNKPDLYATLLKHPNGINWLKQQVKLFMESFL